MDLQRIADRTGAPRCSEQHIFGGIEAADNGLATPEIARGVTRLNSYSAANTEQSSGLQFWAI